MEKILTNKKLLLIPLAMLIAAIIMISCEKNTPTNVVSGEVEVREVDIASKIPARIDTIMVREGESVVNGQILARLASPEIEAKIGQAKAAAEAAKALLEMAIKGARAEDIEAAKQTYEAAKAQYNLADNTLQRISGLYDKKSVTSQTYDETKAKYDAAKAQMNAAEQIWLKARKGARAEEINAARDNFNRANQSLAEVLAMAAEIEVKAPQSGEIEKQIAEPGEVIAAGYPIITLVDLNDAWITLYLTEDKMPGIFMGRELKADIPALGKKQAAFKVDFISAAGDFATRKAVKEQDGFDLKSFEIHLRPLQPVQGLRAGMSARIAL
ncbi:MAG: efflux RND transporter periplasmic adaptor subunit [Candidatus Cloacimonas sp.]|jgi:HlyD family secretion protein|nr:efflux RND transporter periplasmic adaptor subunit [Candidatus Cloacimonas sp.]